MQTEAVFHARQTGRTDMETDRMRYKRIIALLGAAMVIFSGCGRAIESNSAAFSKIEAQTTVSTIESTAEESSAEDAPQTTAETEETSAATEETAAETEKTEKAAESKPSDDSSSQTDKDDKKDKTDTADDLSVPYSKAYALCRADDGMLIAQSGLYDKISLASITKLLSASVMLQYYSPDDEVTVGDEVYLAKPDSTLSYISPGLKLKVSELIAAMLLPSGNDAAYTVAVNTARAAAGDSDMNDQDAVEYFCGLMNGFAAELDMGGSHFANPEGWDDAGHYTTLGDLLKLAKYVLNQPELRKITGMYQKSVTTPDDIIYTWTNTNLFLDPNSLYYRKDCIGLKTGTTNSAGCCIVTAFDINGSTYICAVMGCNENYDRYDLVQKILNKYIQ